MKFLKQSTILKATKGKGRKQTLTEQVRALRRSGVTDAVAAIEAITIATQGPRSVVERAQKKLNTQLDALRLAEGRIGKDIVSAVGAGGAAAWLERELARSDTVMRLQRDLDQNQAMVSVTRPGNDLFKITALSLPGASLPPDLVVRLKQELGVTALERGKPVRPLPLPLSKPESVRLVRSAAKRVIEEHADVIRALADR